MRPQTCPGTPCIGEHSGRGVDENEFPISPGVLSMDVAPTETPVFDPQGDVFVTLWEQFNWETAIQMMSLVGDKRADIAMCRLAAP